MGFYEDHIEAVANRRASNLTVYGVDMERKALKDLGWSEEETERIIKREIETNKRQNVKKTVRTD